MEVRFYPNQKTDKSGDSPIEISLSSQGVRFRSSTGYKIAPEKWDKVQQKVKRGGVNASGMPYNIINLGLDKMRAYFGSLDDVNQQYSKDDLATAFRKFRDGNGGANKTRPIAAKDTNPTLQTLLLKFSVEQGNVNGWSEATYKKFTTLGRHFDAYRRDMRVSEINERVIDGFVVYLVKKGYNNTYTKKMSKIAAWFLRWVQKQGYCQGVSLDGLAPKLKIPEKTIIYLDWEELMAVYNYKAPATKNYLAKVRDIFCFCCFTGLRFSDAQNLKRADVYGDSISISSIKTTDRLIIPLSKYAKAILDRYATADFNGKALPPISNVKANKYLKELCATVGIDRLVTTVCFRGGQREEMVRRKWELVGTHCGRRTFISNALLLGMPATTVMAITGHSGFQAMKPYIAIAEQSKKAAMALFDER